MLTAQTQKSLSIFARNVKKDSIVNLKDKSTSEKLKDSIDYDLRVHKQSFSLDFEMEDYGEYQDKGVSGTEKKYNTPFSYRDKKPPISAFDKWSVKKGLAPRDAGGKFQSRESLKYALSNHIFTQGIKPSLFFTKAFERHFRKLPDEVIEAYGLDMEKFLITTLKNDTN